MSNKLTKTQEVLAWGFAEKINTAILANEAIGGMPWWYYQEKLFSDKRDWFDVNSKFVRWLEEKGYVMPRYQHPITRFFDPTKFTKSGTQRLKSIVQWCDSNSKAVESQRKRLGATIAAGHKRRTNERRKGDLNFKMRGILRSRIYGALKGHLKSSKTETLLGCTISEFRQYIESKFIPGMRWDNHGEWHVDHIRPCCSFDLSDPKQQRECFHFLNLQPLWAMENFKKNGKWQPK